MDQAKADLVLIVDEVQQAILSEDGNQMLLALKAARDVVNLQPHMPGSFLFIGMGSPAPWSVNSPMAVLGLKPRPEGRLSC